jgi:class 3 adenylate cyclase/catechol 2,3-dioxygenase-like lactoylglutathione lyase family enzyme
MTIRIIELHRHAVSSASIPGGAERLRDFYCGVLGLTADPGRVNDGSADSACFNVGEQGQIQILGGRPGDAITREGPVASLPDPREARVALAVADIAEAHADLERRGIPHRVLGGDGSDPRSLLLLRDPAGNVIELHQWGTCRCSIRTRVRDPQGYMRIWSAVMFADMRGFTRISERLSPSEVVPLLNEYFDLLTGIAVDHGGTVFNMAGDGLMIGFGVPREQADASLRALQSAQEMLTRFGSMANDWKRRHDVDTGLGIGINAGEVIAGHVGSANFTSYTIVGDTVNVASRLSQRARAGEALFSSEVRRALDFRSGYLNMLELPALQLRGRAAPVEIYCLPAGGRLDLRPDHYDAPVTATLATPIITAPIAPPLAAPVNASMHLRGQDGA